MKPHVDLEHRTDDGDGDGKRVRATRQSQPASRVDLSQPGLRPSVLARTLLAGDQYSGNDQLATEIYIVPSYTPPYQGDFEDNNGFWRSQGNFWEFGVPAGSTIDGAASGSQSWVTGLSSTYGNLMSEQNRKVFEDGLASMIWCSSDPLCIEGLHTISEPANGAACHACLLASETSCEEFNSFLDRALLFGSPTIPELGYFRDYLHEFWR